MPERQWVTVIPETAAVKQKVVGLSAEQKGKDSILSLKVLENLSHLQPVPEAGQTLVPDLLSAFVCDHLAIFLHNYQFGHGRNVVPLLEVTVGQNDGNNKTI